MSDDTNVEPPQPSRDPIPAWVIVAVALAVAATAATGVYLLMQSSAQQQQARLDDAQRAVTDLAAKVDQLTQVASQTVATATAPAGAPTPPAPAPTPAPPAPHTPTTTKEWAFVTGGSTSGGKLYIKADYIYFYTGAAAVAAQATYGGSLRPDGSYVRNTSPTIRTLRLSSAAKISLVEWLETGTPGSSWKLGDADPAAFVAVLKGTASSPSGVWNPAQKALELTLVDSVVTRIEQYTHP